MKTKEEILQERIVHQYTDDDKDERIDITLSGALEAMELYAEQFKPKWISVEDQTPEMYTNVLCIQKGNNIPLMAHYCEDGYEVKKYTSKGDRVLVTYWTDVLFWMPLPTFKA